MPILCKMKKLLQYANLLSITTYSTHNLNIHFQFDLAKFTIQEI